jgi:hypothetical protein
VFHRIFSRRALVTSAVVVAATACSVAGVSLAQGAGAGPPAPAPAVAGQGGILGGVHDALARLVAAGTIDQQQADAVQAQANAGSIDPKQLVRSGTLTDAQMRTVGNVIAQIKLSYGR